MSIRLLRNAARRFARRDDTALLDPALVSSPEVAEPALAVADVVTVEPVEKTYRAVVTRTVTQTALVEFVALEGTDTMTMAQGLLETVPPESWVTQPSESWGYIDSIEEVGAAADVAADPTDPLATPAALSRRRRALARRFARKAAFDVSVDGVLFGTYDAETAEDAILAYVAEAGYATVDEAAAAAGMTAEDFLASVTATEALVALEDETIPEDDEDELPPETLARRRRSRRSAFDDPDGGEAREAALDEIRALDRDLQVYVGDDGFLTGGGSETPLLGDAVNALQTCGYDQISAELEYWRQEYAAAQAEADAAGGNPMLTLDDETIAEEEDVLPPETLARRRALGFGRRSRRSRRSTDWEIAAADAWAYLAKVGWESVEAQVPNFFGGASAEVDEAAMVINVYDESGILVTVLRYDEAIIIDLAESMGYVSVMELDDETADDEDELPPETLSRRRRRAA